MGLFTDIYNTVAKFFRPQDENGDASKALATNRLKLVLMQDRTNLTPKVLEQMRGELVDLLSKYLEMDKDLLELNFEQEGDQVALMLSIPVIRAKDEEEIEAALAAQKNSTEDVEDVDNDEEDEDLENEEDDDEISDEIETAVENVESSNGDADIDKENQSKHKKRRRRGQSVSSPEGLEITEDVSETTEEIAESAEG